MSGYSIPQNQFIYQGAAAASGTLRVYKTGTTTLQTIYSDGGLTTPITNPMTLDANGQALFYCDGTTNLRLDAYTATGAFIESIDPVFPVGGTANGSVIVQGSNRSIASTDKTSSFIASTAIQLSLPLTTTLTADFNFEVNAYLGAVTLAPNAADKIMGGTAGASLIIPTGGSARVETDANGNWYLNFNNSAGTGLYSTSTGVTSAQAQMLPGGRLTLLTGIPVPNADALAQPTIYYAPYLSNRIPIWDGSENVINTFSQLTLTLNAAANLSTKLYDIFIYLNAGVVSIGTGPAWSNAVSRGAGAGTTELMQTNGFWANKNTISLKNNGVTVSNIAAGKATYVGTAYMDANASCSMVLGGYSSSSNNILGLYNAYNQVAIVSEENDSTASWSYTTATWRASNNSTNNRITFVDGLASSPLRGEFTQNLTGSTNGTSIGINIDATTGAPAFQAIGPATINGSATALFSAQAILGQHYVQAMESGNTGNSQKGGALMTLRLTLMM